MVWHPNNTFGIESVQISDTWPGHGTTFAILRLDLTKHADLTTLYASHIICVPPVVALESQHIISHGVCFEYF